MLTNVTVTTKSGGAGGLGGDGQRGGKGGQQGNQGASGACPGGPGGQGGTGGPGGGGAGGHSIGIAINGGTVPDLKSTTLTHGSGGMGGCRRGHGQDAADQGRQWAGVQDARLR
jgi:hypothetical protein